MLLLHGLGGSIFSWRLTMPRLAPFFSVWALDLPGHGEAPPRPSRSWTLEALIWEILEFLAAQQLTRPVLVGHSLGGALAVLLAGLQPQRFPAVVLLAPAVLLRRLPWPIYPLRLPLLGHLAPHVIGPWLVPFILRRLFYDPRQITPAVIAGYQRPYRRLARRQELVRLCRALTLWPLTDQERWLQRLTMPTLVLWGTEDRILPAALLPRVRQLLPCGEAHLLPACGHNLQEEAPESVAHLILAFLRRWGTM